MKVLIQFSFSEEVPAPVENAGDEQTSHTAQVYSIASTDENNVESSGEKHFPQIIDFLYKTLKYPK